MITKAQINDFYDDVELLGLKFPNAEIAKVTKQSKGAVSEYLNKKKEPSEQFLKLFYEGFGSSLKVLKDGKEKHKTPTTYEVTNETILQAIMKLTESNEKIVHSNNEAVATTKVVADTNKTLADSNAELVRMLKDRSGPVNLSVPDVSLQLTSIIAHLKTIVQLDALARSGGDIQKAEKILAETGKMIVSNAGLHSVKDTRNSKSHN